MTCALNGVKSSLGTEPCLGLRTTLQSFGPNSRQDVLTESACKAPSCLTDAKASRRAALSKRGHGSADCRAGLKEGASESPEERGQVPSRKNTGTRRIQPSGPFKNRITKSFLPAD